jgi:hypothetical protein
MLLVVALASAHNEVEYGVNKFHADNSLLYIVGLCNDPDDPECAAKSELIDRADNTTVNSNTYPFRTTIEGESWYDEGQAALHRVSGKKSSCDGSTNDPPCIGCRGPFGSSQTEGIVNTCPDTHQVWTGGNLSIAILEMRNIPDLDGYGPAGGESDPYVSINITASVRESGFVRNSVNPIWKSSNYERWMNFGSKVSGTIFNIEVWDKDAGLEFEDDIIGTVQTNVIYCSMMTAQDGFMDNHILLNAAEIEDYTLNEKNGGGDAYASPIKKYCQEDVWLSLHKPEEVATMCVELGGEQQCGCVATDGTEIMDLTGATCIKIRQTIIPFRVGVAQEYLVDASKTCDLDGSCTCGDNDATCTRLNTAVASEYTKNFYTKPADYPYMSDDSSSHFRAPHEVFNSVGFNLYKWGRPYVNSDTVVDAQRDDIMRDSWRGGYFLQTQQSAKSCPFDPCEWKWGVGGTSNELDTRYALLEMNLPGKVMVFKHHNDFDYTVDYLGNRVDSKPVGNIPEWLKEVDANGVRTGWNFSAAQLTMIGEGGADPDANKYIAFEKEYDATPKKWCKNPPCDLVPPMEDTGIMLRMNRGRGTAENSQAIHKMPEKMYVVIVKMTEQHDVPPLECSKDFDRKSFFLAFAQYGVMMFIFLALWSPFFDRIDYRFNRIGGFLLQSKMGTEKDCSVVATLFDCYNDCPQNAEYRRNLYWAQKAVYLLMCVPLVILWTWGMSTFFTTKPGPVGLAICLVGTAAFLSIIATKQWYRNGFRVTNTTVRLFGYSIVCVFVFLILVIWRDPNVTDCGRPVSFFALTAVFVALNSMPMIWLAFTNDVQIRKSLKQLTAVISSKKKTQRLRDKFKRLGALGLKLGLEKGKTMRSRGEMPKSLFQDLVGDAYTICESMRTFRHADVMSTPFAARDSKRRANNIKFYLIAQAFLALWLVLVHETMPSRFAPLAWTIFAAILATDAGIYLLRRGSLTWSPAYMTFIMMAIRICLVGGATGEYWLLGLSLVVFVFGIAICYEIIQKRMKELKKYEAGGIVFFGYNLDVAPVHDISATPEFVLCYISFIFVFYIVLVMFSDWTSLPLPSIELFGQQWPVLLFGVIAFCLMLVVGLMEATQRAFMLSSNNLLPPQLKALFFFFRSWKLPEILAATAELFLICTGLLVYAWAGSLFVCIVCCFGPILIGLGMYVYGTWRQNGCRLVVWPPEDFEEEDAEEDADMEMIGQGTELFSLPPLKKLEEGGAMPAIQMPSLPLKSALKKKEPSSAPASTLSFGNIDGRNAPATNSLLDDDDEVQPPPESQVFRPGETPWQRKHWGRAFLYRTTMYWWDVLWRDVLPPIAWLCSFLWGRCKKIKTVQRCLHRLEPHTAKVAAAASAAKDNAKKVKDRAKKSRFGKYQKVIPGDDAEGETPKGDTPGEPGKEDDKPLLTGGPAEGGDAREGVEEDGGDHFLEVDFTKMSLLHAFCEGYLLHSEYAAISGLLALVACLVAFGNIIAYSCGPWWLGHTIWIVSLVLIFSIAPTIKWFNVYTFTSDMLFSYLFAFTALWATGFALFSVVLEGDLNAELSLWLFTICMLYPTFLLLFTIFYKWYDDGWELSPFVVWAFPPVYFLLGLWVIEMFIWVDPIFGTSLLLVYLLLAIVMWFLRAWIYNEFYLPPYYQHKALQIVTAASTLAIVIGFLFNVSLFYTFSVAFVFWISYLVLKAFGRELTRPPGCPLFFAPYIFPVYSYDPHDDQLHNENGQFYTIYGAMFMGLAWGVFCAMFVDPIGIGCALASFMLVLIACVTCSLCSITPVRIGQAAKLVDEGMLKDAGLQAQKAFKQRRVPLIITCGEWQARDKQEREYEAELARLTGGHNKLDAKNSNMMKAKKKAAKKAGGNGGDDLLAQMDAMFGEEEGGGINDADGDGVDDDDLDGDGIADVDQHVAGRKTAAQLAWKLEDCDWKVVYEEDADGKEVRRFDSLLDAADAAAETIRGGHGPFGFVALGGYPYWLYSKIFKPDPNSQYNIDGSKKVAKGDATLMDSKKHIIEAVGLEHELASEYHDEMRAIVQFQLLTMVGAESRLSREKVLFQKFLRENRFKLMSNGINPPKDIFSTASHSSINIVLVAIWLLSLTPEERDRFHELKHNFSEEMAVRDMMVDDEDEEQRRYCEEVVEQRKQREDVMCRRRYQDFLARRLQRQQAGMQPQGPHDESLINAQEFLLEIETSPAGRFCKPGKFGRPLQFHDPEFPADRTSVGKCAAAKKVKDWKVSSALNINAGLFDGGTDPDDVHQGELNDGWLLSAISIIAASGGVDDDKVDELLNEIFISKTLSPVGAYAVRFWKNSQWETVIVDDFFPTQSKRNEENNGAAFAYSKSFRELWVPILEKAYAKYYGSYAALEEGFVHLALQDLAQGESSEIFLARESRGARKAKLWENMREWQRNAYLMGAGTITSDNADNEIQDSGLVFGACYVVYEVREVDGNQLIKLRNPPGDHAEWRGDWGDLSPLWNRRLKHKLGWTDDDDNTFWMSFDDFCNAFRSLYLCKRLDSKRWPSIKIDHTWSVEDGTAVGLPSKHNPACDVELNPQFSLKIDRPTEVCITLSQVDPEGLANPEVHPVAFYICKNKSKIMALPMTELTRKTVVEMSQPGTVVRKHEIKCYCKLEPASYTLLCGTYMPGMEGTFSVKIQSNFPVHLDQLWPVPPEEDIEPTTRAGKLAKKARLKAQEQASKIAAKAKEKAGKLKEKHQGKIDKIKAKGKAVAGAVVEKAGKLTKDEMHAEAEKKLAEEKAAADKAEAAEKAEALENCKWVEQWDPNESRFYYYNAETGVAVWEKPSDFVDGVHDDSMDAATKIQSAFRGKKSRKKKDKQKTQEEQAVMLDWTIEMYDEDDDEWEEGKATCYTQRSNMIYCYAHDSGNEGNLKLDFKFIKLVSCDDGGTQGLYDELFAKQEAYNGQQ